MGETVSTPLTPPSKQLVANCPPKCGMNANRIGAKNAAILMAMRANGAGAVVFRRRAVELLGDMTPVMSAIQNHLNHYREVLPDGPLPDTEPVPNDVAILDSIVAQGYRFHKAWRPTIKDVLEAMKLKSAMTGNSAFEDMLSAMNKGLDLAEGVPDDEEAEEAPESQEAVLSPDEREPVQEDE